MTPNTLVLDANSFDAKGFVHWLSTYRGGKVLPIIAYVELGILFQGRGQMEKFRSTLSRAGITVEWFRSTEAETAIETGATAGDFGVNARDHLIAAHARGPERVLVTFNTKDFRHVGRVATPTEIMAA